MVISNNKGFTLLELMLVLTIAGILATIGMPAMRDMMLNQKVKTAASDLHLSLLLARSEAIKRSSNVVMERNTSWDNGWSVKAGSTVLRTRDPLNGLSVECSTDSDDSAETCPASVTFQRSGRPTAYTQYRLFVDGNDGVTMRCITIGLSGVADIALDKDNNTGNGCG